MFQNCGHKTTNKLENFLKILKIIASRLCYFISLKVAINETSEINTLLKIKRPRFRR